jgi:hypothetical protein
VAICTGGQSDQRRVAGQDDLVGFGGRSQQFDQHRASRLAGQSETDLSGAVVRDLELGPQHEHRQAPAQGLGQRQRNRQPNPGPGLGVGPPAQEAALQAPLGIAIAEPLGRAGHEMFDVVGQLGVQELDRIVAAGRQQSEIEQRPDAAERGVARRRRQIGLRPVFVDVHRHAERSGALACQSFIVGEGEGGGGGGSHGLIIGSLNRPAQ